MRALCAALTAAAAAAAPVAVQSLGTADGVAWTLSNANGSLTVPAGVPGSAHTDLLAAGAIPEPYSDLVVDAVRWVADEDWAWSAGVAVAPALRAKRSIELVSEGVDAHATVTVNGAVAWSQTDAFVRTAVDVTGLLGPAGGTDAVRVVVTSPRRAAAAAAAACTGFCPPVAHDGNASAVFDGFNYIRKPAVGAGWDFAPPFMPSGVWQRLYLRAFDAAALDAVTVTTTPRPDVGPSAWAVTFTAYATAAADGVPVAVAAAIDGVGAGGVGATTATLVAGAANAVNVSLLVAAAPAWWPAGHGAQPLFNATVTLTGRDAGGANESSSLTWELGFRTVALLRPPAPDGTGRLFAFAVNGAPVYVKGANWVPNDAFPTRGGGAAQFEPKLDAFVAANFNALRVWGGGYPPSDAFYAAAARRGLLLWQEMPFACAGYATTPADLADVAAESRSIALRLQKFPALLVWGGNNEVQSSENYRPGSAGAGNFSLLFFGAMAASIRAVDGTRPFLSTSPGSGGETPDAPVAYPAQTPSEGDMHVRAAPAGRGAGRVIC